MRQPLTRAVLWCWAAWWLAACASPPPPPIVPPPVIAPPASAAPVAPPSARHADPLWILAASDDPAEKARLAFAVGAAELLDAVNEGGDIAEIALAALPFADDGEIALGRLGDLLRAPGAPRRSVLDAILGVADQPARSREALDPEGAAHCGAALLAAASDASLPREERAIALSAARALAEKGYVDRARIPADLDPPAAPALGSGP